MNRVTFSKLLFLVLLVGLLYFFLDGNSLNTDLSDYEKDKSFLDPKMSPLMSKISESIKTKHILSNGMIESEARKTTSESQSYAMLMSVYVNDKNTFDSVWDWTKKNLQVRQSDKLFSWLWENGKVSDINSATDADQDIAYALYLAYKKWGDKSYLNSSEEIVSDIWDFESKELEGIRYIAAGNWAINFSGSIIVNPSYLAPYQYRIFSIIDPKHDWKSVVDSSYKLVNLCSSSSGLARDWCQINATGKIIEEHEITKEKGSNYSYDALRVPYRIAMDYLLNDELKAINYLERNKVFSDDWHKKEKIFAQYDQRGRYIENNESLANYGAQVASLSLTDRKLADSIIQKKIQTVSAWEDKSFYDMSWVWFGLHFYSESITKSNILTK